MQIKTTVSCCYSGIRMIGLKKETRISSAGEGTEQGGLWLTAEENNMVTRKLKVKTTSYEIKHMQKKAIKHMLIVQSNNSTILGIYPQEMNILCSHKNILKCV